MSELETHLFQALQRPLDLSLSERTLAYLSTMSDAPVNSLDVNEPFPANRLLQKLLEKADRPLMTLTNENMGCSFSSAICNKNLYEPSAGGVTDANDSSVLKNMKKRVREFELFLRTTTDDNLLGQLLGPLDDGKRVKAFLGDRTKDAYKEIRVLALDRILWCREERLEMKRRLAHQPSGAVGVQLANLLSHVYNWKARVLWLKGILNGLERDHELYRRAQIRQTSADTSSHLTEDDAKTKSLVELEGKGQRKESAAKLMRKFARVASSLRILSQDKSEERRKQMIDHSTSDDLTNALKAQEPIDFYRLLIICVAVSPLALLGDSMWGKVSFPKAYQGARMPIPQDPMTTVLSKALTKMYVSLSEQGSEAYYPLLLELAETLESKGVFKAAEAEIVDQHPIDEHFFAKEYEKFKAQNHDQAAAELYSIRATYVKVRRGQIPDRGEDGELENDHGDGSGHAGDDARTENPPATPAGGSEPALSRAEENKKRKREDTERKERERAEKEKEKEKEKGKKPQKRRKTRSKKNKNDSDAAEEEEQLNESEDDEETAPAKDNAPKPPKTVYYLQPVNMVPPKNRGKGLKGTLVMDVFQAVANGIEVIHEPIQVEIPKYSNCSVQEYADLETILSKNSNQPSEVNVEVVAWDAWELLTFAEKRRRLAVNSIHVVGKKGPSVMPHFQGWDKASLGHYMDVNLMRSVNDHTMYRSGEKPLYRASLATAIESINKDQDAVFNFLDIKLPPGRIRPDFVDLEDGPVLARSHYVDHSWNTPLYSGSSSWALVSLKNAMSGIHMDAAGYCTFVEAVRGRKIWIIGSDPKKGVPVNEGWDPKDSNWSALVINAGDQLYMRPATPHMVITTEHSIFAGGHFYLKEQMERSLKGILLCHFYGYDVTNEAHLRAPTAFHRLGAHYANEMLKRVAGPNADDEYEFELSRDEQGVNLPSDEELAWLAVLVFHLDNLSPPVKKPSEEKEDEGEGDDDDEDAEENVWKDTKYDADQAYVKYMLRTLIEKKFAEMPDFREKLKEANRTFLEWAEACGKETVKYQSVDNPDTLITYWGFEKMEPDEEMKALLEDD